MIKLDYTLESVEERLALVEKFLEENPNPGAQYLETLADYVILFAAKQEAKEQRKQQRELITDNRLATINKRETSFEGLAAQFENGEDGIYNLINEDKNMLLDRKPTITKKDLETISYLRQIRDSIELWQNILADASGRDAYIAKSAIIDLRRDQYIVKDAYLKPCNFQGLTVSKHPVKLSEDIQVHGFLDYTATGITLLDPKVISTILCNYSKLKESSYGKFDGDTWYLMEDFDNICGKALREYPLYSRIIEYKIDNKQNLEIQSLLEEEFGIKHTVEYISSLWRKKIPALIASYAEDEFFQWYYTHSHPEDSKWKKCSRCGQIKLAHPKYFTKNSTSKDGLYSLCKACRNKKYKEAKK